MALLFDPVKTCFLICRTELDMSYMAEVVGSPTINSFLSGASGSLMNRAVRRDEFRAGFGDGGRSSRSRSL